MSVRTRYILFIFFIHCVLFVHAQISPGKLSADHAHLEGMSNCTQCHELGNKVTDQKCLDCHKEISSLQNLNRGFHSSSEVTTKECIDCHSEHHGRKFDMVRFDQDNFNHDLTGFRLEGAHTNIDCRDCHKPTFISDVDIKKRENTFLGMGIECLDCHEDFHNGSLSQNCLDCHNQDAFAPVDNFDHDDTNFPLHGKHKNVDCQECHPISIQDGKEIQLFKVEKYHDCISCHDNPHQVRWNSKCSDCHSESSFQILKKRNTFNHSNTSFALKGKHRQTSCFECHDENLPAKNILKDLNSLGQNDCVECHNDVHDTKFGNDCATCHNEESFFTITDMNQFDHNLTDYPLEGLHSTVDCRECHKSESYLNKIDFSACINCHTDYHEGQFTQTDPKSDCKDCHELTQNFSFTTFGIEEHNNSDFVLEGAHLATPCFDCHLEKDKWTFRNVGNECVDCHEDIHKDFISAKFYPNQDCKYCHISEAWTIVDFDHDQTQFILEGKHKEVNCKQCHFDVTIKETTFEQVFINLNNECIDCHQNPHGDQFVQNNQISCQNCHTSYDWKPENFDHDQTNFKLTGRHAEIKCNACHKEEIEINDKLVRIYQIDKFECIDCHL